MIILSFWSIEVAGLHDCCAANSELLPKITPEKTQLINGSIDKCQQPAYNKSAIIINAILEIHDAWEAQAVLRTQIHD